MCFYLEHDFLSEIMKIAYEAGQSIMEIYKGHISVFDKEDDTPLTNADLTANKIICDSLNVLDSTIPIISEESYDFSWEKRKLYSLYWLIDPLDGTKEFLKKNGEFTVNIALINDGLPILGVVYAPALGEVYWGDELNGAWYAKYQGEQCRIKCQKHEDGKVWKVVASRSHPSPDMAAYLDKLGEYELISLGSSLKICAVAKGEAHLYPRLGLTSEWDTAAAHAIVLAAGGDIFTLEGHPMRYNQKESLLNPHFIVRPL